MSWVDEMASKFGAEGIGQSYKAMHALSYGVAAALYKAGADREDALQMVAACFGIWSMSDERVANWENAFTYWVDQYYRRKLWRK
jgi:hypothetical protein